MLQFLTLLKCPAFAYAWFAGNFAWSACVAHLYGKDTASWVMSAMVGAVIIWAIAATSRTTKPAAAAAIPEVQVPKAAPDFKKDLLACADGTLTIEEFCERWHGRVPPKTGAYGQQKFDGVKGPGGHGGNLASGISAASLYEKETERLWKMQWRHVINVADGLPKAAVQPRFFPGKMSWPLQVDKIADGAPKAAVQPRFLPGERVRLVGGGQFVYTVLAGPNQAGVVKMENELRGFIFAHESVLVRVPISELPPGSPVWHPDSMRRPPEGK